MSETFSTTQESLHYLTIKKAIAVFAVGASAFGLAGCNSEKEAPSVDTAGQSSETSSVLYGEGCLDKARELMPKNEATFNNSSVELNSSHPTADQLSKYTAEAGGNAESGYIEYSVDMIVDVLKHRTSEVYTRANMDPVDRQLSERQIDQVSESVRKTLEESGKTLPLEGNWDLDVVVYHEDGTTIGSDDGGDSYGSDKNHFIPVNESNNFCTTLAKY